MSSQKGFSLVEMMLVILLVAAGVIVITNMFISQNRLYQTQNAELEITSSVRTGLDDIDNYVRQANRVVASYSTYTSGPQVLVLQLQSVNASDQLIAGTYDYVVYELDNGNLNRMIFSNLTSSREGGVKLLGTSITTLNFTYNDANFASVTEVSTTITASKSAANQTRSFSANSKSKLRAY